MQYRLALLLAALPGLAAAQRQRPAARGAASITIADVQRRIGVIADDSMLGRATPSPQLDAVAAYVAGEFQRFGLRPGELLNRRPVGRFLAQDAAGDQVLHVRGAQDIPDGIAVLDLAVKVVLHVAGVLDLFLQRRQDPGMAMPLVERRICAQAVEIAASLDVIDPDAGGALDSTAVTGKIVFLAYGPGLNTIAAKVLPLRPLAIVLVAGFPDSIWAKLPGHEASVSVRNPSAESGPAVPAVFALRTATAGALFTQGGVSPDSLRAWGDRPLVARPLADITLQLDVRGRVLQHAVQHENRVGVARKHSATRESINRLFLRLIAFRIVRAK